MSESTDIAATWQQANTAGQPVLRTMVVCDLADSTALIDRLGDRRAAALLRKHDRMTRVLIDEHGGREIDKTDGYLLLFERPAQAVAFALAYHRGLQFMSEAEEVSIRARVGIHVGDVVMWENTPEDISRGAKPLEVEGLTKPIAARLAALARPQQILLTSVAASIARRGYEEIAEESPEVQWCSHGQYRIRGVAEPTEVVQIGEPRIADFGVPRNRGVAHRVLPWWRRTSSLVVAGLVLLLGTGLIAWTIMRQPPRIAFAARDWVVIANVDNQTGQTDFDGTIDTAIRVGLQQSRYVNTIPLSKMRQTLAAMKLDANSKVNAKLGAEIALRVKAKALIYPIISNAGNNYLVSARIIDPDNLHTVDTIKVTADNDNAVVPAISRLVKQIRLKLGESLAQIKSSSTPLERVMTSNLEALRAFSLAQRAGNRGDYNLSEVLVEQALKLDPRFASAYALQAANYVSLGYKKLAKKSIDEALRNQDRLSPLNKKKLLALKATIFKPWTDATIAWKVLADLYPDDATGANNVGLFYAAYLNDCDAALPYLKHAASLPQSKTMISTYEVGTCELAIGKSAAAIKSLQKSYAEGFRGPFLALADAYVETRQYSRASAFLAKVPNDSNTLVSLSIRRALIAADQGDLASAESYLRHGLRVAPLDISHSTDWALKLDLIGVLWGEGKNVDALKLTRQDLTTLLSMNQAHIDRVVFDYPTLVLSFSRWAARLGDETLARETLQKMNSNNQLRGYPIRSQLAAITRAEMALHRGDPAAAVHIASAAVSHPIWELLEVLARAKAAAGRSDASAAYRDVIDSRPLAFGELYEDQLGICTRAVQWNIAVLKAAEVMRTRHPREASRRASIFLDNWKMASDNNPFIKTAKALVASEALSIPATSH